MSTISVNDDPTIYDKDRVLGGCYQVKPLLRNSGQLGNEQLYRLRADDRKLRLEVRQILLDDLPNNLHIDIEIIVNDAISQADDFAPPDLGVLGSEILRQAIGGFADDFQIAYYRVDGLIVFYESLVIQPGSFA